MSDSTKARELAGDVMDLYAKHGSNVGGITMSDLLTARIQATLDEARGGRDGGRVPEGLEPCPICGSRMTVVQATTGVRLEHVDPEPGGVGCWLASLDFEWICFESAVEDWNRRAEARQRERDAVVLASADALAERVEAHCSEHFACPSNCRCRLCRLERSAATYRAISAGGEG